MPARFPGQRVVGVDVARGVALLGMAAVHVFPALREDGSLHPSYALVAGRAAALFAVLAGVGLALTAGGTRPVTGEALRAVRAGVLARAGLLVLVGVLLGLVDSPPLVILVYYGVLFLAAVPLLGLPAGALAGAAAGWSLGAPLLSHAVRAGLGDPSAGAGVDVPRAGSDTIGQVLLTGTYPALSWLTYLLAGLALGGLRLTSTRVAASVAGAGALLAVGAKALSGWLLSLAGGPAALAAAGHGGGSPGVRIAFDVGLLGTTPTDTPAWLLVSSPHSGTTLDLVHTTGTAMLVLGLGLLLTRRGAGVLLPLACVGSMTLTLYSAHVLALQRGGPLLLDDPLWLWLAHVAVALVVATCWRTTVGRGPLEAVAAGLDRAARRGARRTAGAGLV